MTTQGIHMATTARLQGVTRTFKDVVAIRNLDLELQPGRIYGLLGPNGSGKTTTLRTMLGLIEPDRGTVELLGGPPSDRTRARVGFVPEQRALPKTATVHGLLVFFGRMRGFSKAEAAAKAHASIERFDLRDKATKRIHTLSNGQQQKVQIALALLCEPDVILLDEPLAALDPQHQELVVRHVRRAAKQGATVIVSTHRLREAQALLDHVIMMYQGKKVLDSPLEDALQDAFDGTWRIRALGDQSWVQGPDVVSVEADGPEIKVVLQPGTRVSALLARAASASADVRSIEAVLPTLHELYLRKAHEHGADLGPGLEPGQAS